MKIPLVIRILMHTIIPYFLSLSILYLINHLQQIIPTEEENINIQTVYSLQNYYSSLDIYQSQFLTLKLLQNNIISVLELQNNLYLIKLDIYGNVVVGKKIDNHKLIELSTDSNKVYCNIITQNLAQESKTLTSIFFDNNLNPLKSYKIQVNEGIEITPISLQESELIFLSNLEKTYIALCLLTTTGIQKLAEYKSNIKLEKIHNQDPKFIVFPLNTETKNSVLIIEKPNFNQYTIDQNIILESYYSDYSHLSFILKTPDNIPYFVKIHKKNKSIKSYKINSNQFNIYNLDHFYVYDIIHFTNQEDKYIIFISKNGVVYRKLKLSAGVSDYRVFSNLGGIFVLFTKDNFPFLVRFSQDIQDTQTPYFTVYSASELAFSLEEVTKTFTLSRVGILQKSDDLKVRIEEEQINIQTEEPFSRTQGTF
ncbi:MAG: hypothetical protein ABDH21_05590 [bacterium]